MAVAANAVVTPGAVGPPVDEKVTKPTGRRESQLPTLEGKGPLRAGRVPVFTKQRGTRGKPSNYVAEQFHTPPTIFAGIMMHFLKRERTILIFGGVKVYTSAEQAEAPTCGVCGRRLGVGYYYACHYCGATYCYAHTPVKCTHAKTKQASPRVPLLR